MKLYLLLLAAFATAAPLSAAPMSRREPTPRGPIISVLLENNVASALVEAKGNFCVVQKDDGYILSRGRENKRYVIHALPQGLRWGEEYPDVYQVSIVPVDRFATISVNGIQYRGNITVYHVGDNNVTLVNEVPIEDYVKSTLAVKYEDTSLSEEALAALAIIARTEAYNKVLTHRTSSHPWDVSAREVGYFGSGTTLPQLDPSVDHTRFMVLESLKDNGPLQSPHLSATKANELAQKGMDAQKILQSTFPSAKIGATITPDQLNIR